MDLFSWERFFVNIPRLIKYLPVTFQIVVIAEIVGIVLGVAIALTRISKTPILNRFFIWYVSFMRGTPMLVQMLVVYYGLPGILRSVFHLNADNWSKITFVCITFALNQGAFLSEIFRSSILAISVGQTEAGYSVGLTKWQTFYRIVLPQASKIAIPSFGIDLVGLFQNTSLAFLIGVMDIMGRAKTIGTSSGHYLEGYIFVAIVFVTVSLLLKLAFVILDKKLLKT
ncbi:cysteine ABC transporter permease [Clostridia bacterium]|nr:cysteine ABC transporter permease [Clostridia bacterium]